LLHNRAFAHHEMNRVYLPLRVPRDVIAETLKNFEWLGIRGYSVTIPHKQAVMEIANVCDDSVKAIGAANTLYRTGSKSWHASNTDCEAAVSSVRMAYKESGDTLKGKRVTVLG